MVKSFIKISGHVQGLTLINNKMSGGEHVIDASEGSVSGLVVDGLFAQINGDTFLFSDLIDAEITNVEIAERNEVEKALNKMLKEPDKRTEAWLSGTLKFLSPEKVLTVWELWEKIAKNLGL